MLVLVPVLVSRRGSRKWRVGTEDPGAARLLVPVVASRYIVNGSEPCERPTWQSGAIGGFRLCRMSSHLLGERTGVAYPLTAAEHAGGEKNRTQQEVEDVIAGMREHGSQAPSLFGHRIAEQEAGGAQSQEESPGGTTKDSGRHAGVGKADP